MTPIGVFHSKGEAAKVYGITGWWMGWLIRTHERIGKGFYYVADGGKKAFEAPAPRQKVGRKAFKVMTPAGLFQSANEAAEFFGFRPKQITEWTRAFPKQFYYIKA